MKAAADDNSPLAQTLTADLYERGIGTPADTKMAFHYYLMAAKQGEPLAKQHLSRFRPDGTKVSAVPQNPTGL